MSDTLPKSSAAPIVEAVLDIDCDMPPVFDLAALEDRARAAFLDRYPKLRTERIQEHRIEAPGDPEPKVSVRDGLRAFQFFQQDGKQLVQMRVQGFSFNRLAPYSSLDDYLPEIERTWGLFVDLASPLQVRLIRLRYINRMLLPATEGRIELEKYFQIAPRHPEEGRLKYFGFVNQHTAVEAGTGNRVNIILANQPAEEGRLPVVLDIEVTSAGPLEPPQWSYILAKIRALRSLKDMVFRSTLTDQCLKLFQA